MFTRNFVGKVAICLTVLVSCVAIAACGGSKKSSGGSGSGTAASASSGSGNSSSVIASAKAAVAKAEAPNGTYVLPTAGPKGNPAVKGKSVYVVACGLAAQACAQPAEQVAAAGKYLGWHVTVVDGKLSPTGYDAGIRQAIAAKANGIVVVAIDCPNAQGALQAAKSAGIKIVGAYAYDCSDPFVGGKSVFNATINNNGNEDQWALEDAKLRADYAIAATGGKAQVLSLDQPEFIVAKWWTKGFEQGLAGCAGCSISEHIPFTSDDLVNGHASQLLSTALLQHPNTNVLFVTSDALLSAVLPAVRQAKAHNPNLIVLANEGFAPTQQLIRQGVVTSAVGIYSPWMGWSAADALNRVFNGQTQIPNEGLGYHIITKANVPTAPKIWTPTLPYQKAFEKIWASKG